MPWEPLDSPGGAATPPTAPTDAPAPKEEKGGGKWEPFDPDSAPSGAGGTSSADDALTAGIVSSVPFGVKMASGLESMMGYGSYADRLALNQARVAAAREQHPYLTGGTELAVTSLMPFGRVAKGLEAAGMSARTAALASDVGIGAAYGAGEGGTEGAVAGGIGGGLVGGALRYGAPALRKGAMRFYDPAAVAAGKIQGARAADVAAGDVGVTPAEYAARTAPGVDEPLTQAELGGQATRDLAAQAAKTSPEAQRTMAQAYQTRFQGQQQRQADRIDKMMGFAPGGLDVQMERDAIIQARRQQNLGGYTSVYANSPAVWNSDLQNMLRDPYVQQMLPDAYKRAQSFAVGQGWQMPAYPFEHMADGTVTRKILPDGSMMTPSGMFWDQLRRGLQDAEQSAGYSTEQGRLYGNLKRRMTGYLDQAMPGFQQTRQQAAESFGTENALDQGLAYLKTSDPTKLGDMRADIQAMQSDPRRSEMFARGLAAGVKQMYMNQNTRTDIVNSLNKPEFLNKLQALNTQANPNRSQQFLADMQFEDMMDKMRDQVPKQPPPAGHPDHPWWQELFAAHELGLPHGFGIAGVAVKRFMQHAVEGANQRVMGHVADMLSSGNDAAYQAGIKRLAGNPQLMAGLRRARNGIMAMSGQAAGSAYAQ